MPANCGQKNERALVIDDAIEFWLDGDQNYWHESVGALVIDERPIDCIKREVFEEIGLNFPKEKFELVSEFDLPGDSRRRGSDHHKWHLYRVVVTKDIKIVLNDEAKSAIWLSPKEILNLSGEQVTYPLTL